MFFSVLCLLCFRSVLFIDALWSHAGKWLTSWLSFVMSNCEFVPAGKGLTSWLSYVMSNCEFVTFPLVSWA